MHASSNTVPFLTHHASYMNRNEAIPYVTLFKPSLSLMHTYMQICTGVYTWTLHKAWCLVYTRVQCICLTPPNLSGNAASLPILKESKRKLLFPPATFPPPASPLSFSRFVTSRLVRLRAEPGDGAAMTLEGEGRGRRETEERKGRKKMSLTCHRSHISYCIYIYSLSRILYNNGSGLSTLSTPNPCHGTR